MHFANNIQFLLAYKMYIRSPFVPDVPPRAQSRRKTSVGLRVEFIEFYIVFTNLFIYLYIRI